jgi:hypothetical protein
VQSATSAANSTAAGAGVDTSPLKRVVYVLGTGRCGSTLLDILLGAHPDVCSTGELRQLPIITRGLAQPCSCGQDASLCEFWTSVRSDLEPEFHLSELDAGRKFESTRALPRTSLMLAVPGSTVSRYAEGLTALMRAISHKSGRPIVVDSSKHISRALILWRLRRQGIDVRYVHLVRDGRGFVWSKRRTLDGQGMGLSPPEKSVADLSFWWVVSNLLSAGLFRLRGGRYLRVRYEDLVAQPGPTLATVGRFVGIDLTNVIREVEAGSPVPVGHVVGGNRLRFARGLVLKPDTEWQKNLPKADERTFWGIAGWLARRYGYQARP